MVIAALLLCRVLCARAIRSIKWIAAYGRYFMCRTMLRHEGAQLN